MTREKDPAAVALGRKRQAKMTAEERAQFVAKGARAAANANRKRTPEERRRIARKANMTRRRQPKWIRASNLIEKPEVATPAECKDYGLAQLARAIDELPDELLTELASALAGRLP